MARQLEPSAPDQPLRGLVVVILLALTAFAGSQILLFPATLLLFIPVSPARDLYRACTSLVGAMWFAFAGGLLEHVGGVKLVFSGGKSDDASCVATTI
jgi:hypothetical protein